jgi:hypothetical protein
MAIWECISGMTDPIRVHPDRIVFIHKGDTCLIQVLDAKTHKLIDEFTSKTGAETRRKVVQKGHAGIVG